MKKKTIVILTLAIANIIGGITHADLDNGPWPMFRHDIKHMGRSSYMGGLPVLKWRFRADDAMPSSSAIGSDGSAYISALQEIISTPSMREASWDVDETYIVPSPRPL